MKTLDRRKATAVALASAALSMCFTQAAQAAPAPAVQAVPAAQGIKAGWNDLGSKGVYYQSEYRTKTVKSSGGDFKACITTSVSSKEFYNLYEEDSGSSKRVTTVKGASCWVFRDIGDYVDGDNNRAEFYIGTEEDPEMVRVHYYD